MVLHQPVNYVYTRERTIKYERECFSKYKYVTEVREFIERNPIFGCSKYQIINSTHSNNRYSYEKENTNIRKCKCISQDFSIIDHISVI